MLCTRTHSRKVLSVREEKAIFFFASAEGLMLQYATCSLPASAWIPLLEECYVRTTMYCVASSIYDFFVPFTWPEIHQARLTTGSFHILGFHNCSSYSLILPGATASKDEQAPP